MMHKISLRTAILLNLNIIIGGAIFITAQGISQKCGLLAPLSWIIWGLIVLPIVLILAKLSQKYPLAGGFYLYSHKSLGAFWGFISGWGYFVGTVAGNALLIHKFSEGILLLGGLNISNFQLDLILITFFTLLNLSNIDFLAKTQTVFAILKFIPIAFVIISAFFLFSPQNITNAPIQLSGFFESIPFVFFAYIGFEACCAITHQIKDGKKNAGKAMLISFGLIMGIYFLIQLSLLAIFGTQTTNPFLEIFPLLTNNASLIFWGNRIIEITILSSFLGGYYAMFYANNWILYAIAKEKNLPFSQSLTKLNKYQMPLICILLQGILTALFLVITQNTYYLVTMCSFAIIISYLLSVFAFMAIYLKKKDTKKLILGLLGIVGSFYIFYVCLKELAEAGYQYLIPFLVILCVGLILNKFSRYSV